MSSKWKSTSWHVRVLGVATLVLGAALSFPGFAASPISGPVLEDPIGDPVLSEGTEDAGWGRREIDTVDESGKQTQASILQVEGAEGVAHAPLPEDIRSQLVDELASAGKGENVVFALNADIIDEIQRSIEKGEPTEKLIEYAKQDVDANGGSIDPAQRGPFGSCSDGNITRNKVFNFSPTFSETRGLGNGVTGTLSLEGSGNVLANGELNIKVKRTKVFWVCIPYGVRFGHVRITGRLSLDENAALSGTVNYTYPGPVEYEIAKPRLGSAFFWVGPIPVYFGFNLPIKIGAEFQVSVTGQVQYRGGRHLAGDFDYICTASNCSGSNTIKSTETSTATNPWGAGISGRIKVKAYAEVALRAYLYDEGVAYAQVGVRGILLGDLWGYYGNACGDANQDGYYETVSALTFDLDWQLAITAKADTFLTDEWNSTLWASSPHHIAFWDLLRSSALSPMIKRTIAPNELGTASILPRDTSVNYEFRMRPCWPYSEPVNYTVNWGDSSYAGYSGAPATASHVWTTAGAASMNLTAVSDSHGRTFGGAAQTSEDVKIVYFPVNLAPRATATASSVYCADVILNANCATPNQAIDGINNMLDTNGWRNRVPAMNTAPQWIELAWNEPVVINSVKVFSVAGFGNRIREYDVQYWDGATWVTIASVRGNLQDVNTHTFAPARYRTNKLRVSMLNGALSDWRFAKINEIEVY